MKRLVVLLAILLSGCTERWPAVADLDAGRLAEAGLDRLTDGLGVPLPEILAFLGSLPGAGDEIDPAAREILLARLDCFLVNAGIGSPGDAWFGEARGLLPDCGIFGDEGGMLGSTGADDLGTVLATLFLPYDEGWLPGDPGAGRTFPWRGTSGATAAAGRPVTGLSSLAGFTGGSGGGPGASRSAVPGGTGTDAGAEPEPLDDLVPVPLPAPAWLLVAALAGLAGAGTRGRSRAKFGVF